MGAQQLEAAGLGGDLGSRSAEVLRRKALGVQNKAETPGADPAVLSRLHRTARLPREPFKGSHKAHERLLPPTQLSKGAG